MTRLAATDPAMAFDITVTNRDHIVHWLDRYVVTLQELRRRVADEDAEESLYKLIAATEWEYTGFRAGNVGREQRSTMSTLEGMDFGDFIAGSWVTDKLQALTKEAEDRVAERDAEKQIRRQL
ncbi:MAG: prephenate dehydrogenase/arogenate dehydrogenase family protein [Chloroflexi bacterium]|nr:prephenate dehydrogenase/arogenate dehydrogenase family protein [Chloroflexota bacterium]